MNQERACAVYATRMGEADKVEGLWFPLPVETLAVPVRKTAEPDQASFLGVEFQRESLKSIAQFIRETSGIVLVLETDNEVIGPSNDDHVATRITSPPLLCPKIQDIMKVD